MKKSITLSSTLLLLAILQLSNWVHSQTAFTAYSPEILTTTCPGSDVNFNAGVYTDLPAGITYSGLTRNVVACNSAGTHYRSANYTSTSLTNAIAENRYVTWSFTASSSVEFTLSEVSLRHERSNTGADNGALYYSINGSAYAQVGSNFVINVPNGRNVFTFSSPVSIPASGAITFRWYSWRTSTTGAGNVRFKGGPDYATGAGIVGTFTTTSTPSTSISSTFNNFFYPLNDGPSTSQSLTVSGTNLTNDMIISPPSNYEISLNAAGPYQTTSLNLSPTLGAISTTSVFVRLISGLSNGNYNGNLTVTSDDPSSPVSIPLTGSVISETLTYTEPFGTVAGTFPLGWVPSGATNWSVSLSSPSAGSAFANLADEGTVIGQEAVMTINRAISTVGVPLVNVSWLARRTSAYSGSVLLDYSIDGLNWINVPFAEVPNNSIWALVSVNLPSPAGNVSNLRLRLRTTRSSTSGNYRLDDFTVAPAGTEVNLSVLTNSGSETAQTSFTINAIASAPVLVDETINLAVSGTNVNSNDYILSSPTITLLAGTTTGSVTFTISDDNLNEVTETATIAITGVSSALSLGATSSLAITIADNDSEISLSALNVPNPTIDFNELQNFGTNLFDLTSGFYLLEQGSNANSVYRADIGTSNTGDTYSYGANFSTERSLGSLTTSALQPNTFGAKLLNATGQTMNALNVAYTGEQWRVAEGAEDALKFYYSLDATGLNNGTWVEISDLHFTSPSTLGSPAGALDGNLSQNQESLNFQISGTTLANNATMWIKWQDENIPNNDHGLAIDNLVLTPIFIPAPANDECANAISFGALNSSVNCLTVNLNGATSSLSPCIGTGGNDVWYSFTVPTSAGPSAEVYYATTSISGSTDQVFELFTGCSGFSISCSDLESGSFTIVPGTYYLRTYSFTGQSANFNLCLYINPQIPSNDNICSAQLIKPTSGSALNTYAPFGNMSCLNQEANTSIATASGTVESLCGGSNGSSVWYKFTTPACVLGGVVPFDIEITTDNPLTSYNTKITLLHSNDGTCNGTLTSVACNDDLASTISTCGGNTPNTSTIIRADLLPNTNYFVLVDGFFGASGLLEISGRALTTPHTAVSNTPTSVTLTTDDKGASLYSYYYKQVGSPGYSLMNSAALTDTRTLTNGVSYQTQVMYRCTSAASQFYRTPVVTVAVPSIAACTPVNALNCTPDGLGGYTISWPEVSGLYTNGGLLSGYQIYYRVIGSSGYSLLSNPTVTCAGGVCSYTFAGLTNPAGYEFWIKTRCSSTVALQSNIATCAGSKSAIGATHTFVNPTTGAEFYDIALTEDWNNFGLEFSDLGDYYVGINKDNEIYAVKTAEPNMIHAGTDVTFELVPNPTNASTTMTFNNTIKSGTFQVVDAMGREVLSGDISNTNAVELDGSNWNAGVYLVQVTTNDKTTMRRLVVSK